MALLVLPVKNTLPYHAQELQISPCVIYGAEPFFISEKQKTKDVIEKNVL